MNLDVFRSIFDHTRVVLDQHEVNAERRLAVMGPAKLALEEFELGIAIHRLSGSDIRDKACYIICLRDMLSYVLHELPTEWYNKIYSPVDFGQLLMVAKTVLEEMGLDTGKQPDWRTEAYRLYKSHQLDENLPTFEDSVGRYLHQRYLDDET